MERKQCEFQLIRYVPDPVKNEFVNIGVLRPRRGRAERAAVYPGLGPGPLPRSGRGHGDAGSAGDRGRATVARPRQADHPKPIMALLEASLSNGLQITESKAYLAESFLAGLEDLMRRYVDTPRRERSQRRSGRSALHAAMRTRFEEAGVWTLMRKQIAAAHLHQAG